MDSSKKNPGRRPPAKSSSNSRSDSPSTTTKPTKLPPRAQGAGAGHPVPARAQRPSKYVDDREGGEDANTTEEGGDDADEDSDEWMEVEDDDEAENKENNEMSDHSLGQDNKEDDDDVVEITETQMSRTKVAAGKRKKKSGVAIAKKKTRAKRAECWKYFKLVKAVSKKKPDEVVEKAKCLGCFKLLCIKEGQQARTGIEILVIRSRTRRHEHFIKGQLGLIQKSQVPLSLLIMSMIMLNAR